MTDGDPHGSRSRITDLEADRIPPCRLRPGHSVSEALEHVADRERLGHDCDGTRRRLDEAAPRKGKAPTIGRRSHS